MEAGKKAESCDYTPLKACLDKNNNDRSKCLKEWDEFQKACREKKYVLLQAFHCNLTLTHTHTQHNRQKSNDNSECVACKEN